MQMKESIPQMSHAYRLDVLLDQAFQKESFVVFLNEIDCTLLLRMSDEEEVNDRESTNRTL